eukprot:8014911-Pyramimonas_sp.AAC.1
MLFELGDYKSLDDRKAPRPNDILKFDVLLTGLFRLEKRGKFRPLVMQDVLFDTVHEFSLRPLNKSSFCNKAWGRFVAKQLGVMIRHARQIAESEKEFFNSVNNITGGDETKKKFVDMIKKIREVGNIEKKPAPASSSSSAPIPLADACPPPSSRPKRRLEPQISDVSAVSA